MSGSEERIINMLEQQTAILASVVTRFDKFEEKFDRLEEKFGRLEERFDKLEERFDRLEERFDRLEERFDRLEERFDKLEERFDRLEKRFDTLEAKVDNLELRLDNLEAKVDNLETIVSETKDRIAIIENDHGQKLGALFDGYKLLFDMMGRLRSSFDKLESEQEKHGFMIRWQEASRKKTS